MTKATIRKGRTTVLCAALLMAVSGFGVLPAAADPSAGGRSTVLFSGTDIKEDATFSYIGAVHAFSGDLGRDGFLFRIFGGLGDYEYDTVAVPGGNVETDLAMVDIGLGYQVFSGGLRLSAYASAAYEDHDQSPVDLGNDVRGDEWGFKGNLELETVEGSPIYFGAIGSYSTAFDGYWVRGRVGANIGHGLVLGPEVIALGNEGFDQVRYGAFLSGLPTLWSLFMGGDSRLTLAVGYADTDEDGGTGQGGDDSVYGSISSSFPF